jgi:splicing factor 3A subunit 2
MKNHLGSFECKLCLTLHTTEGNYLSHTQGKRHQQNLGRRAAREEQVLVSHVRVKLPLSF